MFAVSANAQQLLAVRPVASAKTARRAVAARPVASARSETLVDKAMRSGAAVVLSAAIAFAAPDAAFAGLNKMGNSQDAYADMMRQMEEQRCALPRRFPPPSPPRPPIRSPRHRHPLASPRPFPHPSLRPSPESLPAPSRPSPRRKAEGVKSLSVESMYEEQGGACGEGYELVVKKVLGASCECVSPVCADGNKVEGAREVRSDEERAFGKQEAAEDAPPSNSGIKIVFANKD